MQYTNLVWRNGQPYSERFDDIYYSPAVEELATINTAGESCSGEGEFQHVFFRQNNLAERWQQDRDFVIAELGLGSALNCLLTMREWLQFSESTGRSNTLHYVAIEKYPLSPDAIHQLLANDLSLKPFLDELLSVYPPAVATTHIRRLFDGRVVIHFKFIDVAEALNSSTLRIDAWYLDGFSPAKNPDMWSSSLFEKIAANSHPGTTCSTYTAAGSVKRNMQSAGFEVSKVNGYGKKREMLFASMPAGEEHENGNFLLGFKDRPWFKQPARTGNKAKRATVLGAGIAGMSIAHALVKRGWKITIVDRHEGVAAEASANLAAIVYPRLSLNNDVDVEFYLAAYCYAVFHLQSLQSDDGSEKFWFADGLLQSMEKNRLNEIIKKYDFNEAFADVFDGELPVFSSNNQQSFIHYKNSGVVLPAKLCAALNRACADSLQFIHAQVSKVSYEKDMWCCISDSETVCRSEVLIVANGSGIDDLGIDDSGIDDQMPAMRFPVDIVRGQMLALKENPASREIKKTINEDVYITPAIDGLHYLGGTYARSDVDTESREQDTLSLLDSAGQLYPGVFGRGDCNRTWVGFRTMSKDRVAIVGAVPDIKFFENEYADIKNGNLKKTYRAAQYCPGLYISAAHGSRGFTQSFLCAEIIAAQIAGEPIPVSDSVMNYLGPSRFIVNDLKRR